MSALLHYSCCTRATVLIKPQIVSPVLTLESPPPPPPPTHTHTLFCEIYSPHSVVAFCPIVGVIFQQMNVIHHSIACMQVSWKESHEKAYTGRRAIQFFDDEGTAAIKKVGVLLPVLYIYV